MNYAEYIEVNGIKIKTTIYRGWLYCLLKSQFCEGKEFVERAVEILGLLKTDSVSLKSIEEFKAYCTENCLECENCMLCRGLRNKFQIKFNKYHKRISILRQYKGRTICLNDKRLHVETNESLEKIIMYFKYYLYKQKFKKEKING